MRSPRSLAALLALSLASLLAQDPPDTAIAPSADSVAAEDVPWEILVVDEHGEPIFGAELVLDATPEDFERAGGSVRLQSIRSDPDGLISFELPSDRTRTGDVALRDVSRRVPVELVANASAADRVLEVELTIHPDTTFEGLVVSAATGEPLVGVDVFVASSTGSRTYGGSRPLPISIDAKNIGATNRDGAFRFEERGWRTTSVRVAAPGHAPAIVPMAADGHVFANDATIALEPEVRITGRIAFEGLPAEVVANARVQVKYRGASITRGDEGYRFGGGNRYGDSSAIANDGSFEVVGLPGDTPLEVLVVGDRRGDRTLRTVAERLELAPGTVHEIDLTVDAGRTIRGVVVDPVGTPLAGVTVWLTENRFGGRPVGAFEQWSVGEVLAELETDEHGRFAFEEVATGERRVGLAPTGADDAPYPLVRSFTVGDVDPEPIVLVAHREQFITGVVRGPDGEPFEGRVAVDADGSFGSVAVETTDGTFRLGPLCPGEWKVSAMPLTRSEDLPVVTSSDTVSARAGATDVVLDLPAGGAIEIVPVTSEGATIDAQVQLFTAENERGLMASSSGARGVQLHNLRVGRYVALATSRGGLVGLLTFVVEPSVDAGRVEVVMAAGGTLELVRPETADDEWCIATVSVDGQRIAYEPVFGSRPTTIAVPAGTLEVQSFAREDVETLEPLTTHEVVARPGETVRHAFDR